MAHINLLPWRDQLRKERQRSFFIVLVVAALITAAGVAYAHFHVQLMIDHQEARNSLLKQEIAAADQKIREIRQLEKRKADLLARMEIIERLQSSRPEAVHVFDEMVQRIPDGVHLNSFKYTGTAIDISGEAQSNVRVSTYMRNLDSSPWFSDPKLQQIQKRGTVRNFGLKLTQVVPKTAEDSKQ
jgi:type IV pilus assembly protein PilN